jgi:hypothetical protein
MSRKIWLTMPILGMLCGCASEGFEPIQTGGDRYSVNGLSENDNTIKAQQFCRAKGFDYAETTWTDRGFTIFDADKTQFFCMHNGDHLESRSPSIFVNIL